MSNRRHQLIILGSLQWRIIIGAILGVILLINTVIILWFFLSPQLFAHIDPIDTIGLAVFELSVVAVVFYLSLFASNKIAGPMYAIKKCLAQIREGDLTARLHLRRGDLFMDVAGDVNETFDEIAKTINRLKAISERLNGANSGNEERERAAKELSAELQRFIS